MISELVPAPVPPALGSAQRWGPLMLVGDGRCLHTGESRHENMLHDPKR